MPSPTPNWQFQYPASGDLESGWPAEANVNFNALDSAVKFLAGTWSALPSPSTVPSGAHYWVTDRTIEVINYGGSWIWPGASIERIGTVKPWLSTTPPTDPDDTVRWVIANGQALSRTTYASFYAMVGVGYGSGDGSTTFNTPDFRGRGLIGYGTGSGLTTRTLGTTGGEETHLLSAAESGTNTNGVTENETANHNHNALDGIGYIEACFPGQQSAYLKQQNAAVSGDTGVRTTLSTNTQNQRHSHSLAARNADTAHNNMPPFGVINWIVKARY